MVPQHPNSSRSISTAAGAGRLYAPSGAAYAAATLRLIFTDPRMAAHAAGFIASLVGGAIALVGLIVVFGPELAR